MVYIYPLKLALCTLQGLSCSYFYFKKVPWYVYIRETLLCVRIRCRTCAWALTRSGLLGASWKRRCATPGISRTTRGASESEFFFFPLSLLVEYPVHRRIFHTDSKYFFPQTGMRSSKPFESCTRLFRYKLLGICVECCFLLNPSFWGSGTGERPK